MRNPLLPFEVDRSVKVVWAEPRLIQGEIQGEVEFQEEVNGMAFLAPLIPFFTLGHCRGCNNRQ